jgi:hypothetical protein
MCTGRVHGKTMYFTHSKSFPLSARRIARTYPLMLQHHAAQNKNPQATALAA